MQTLMEMNNYTQLYCSSLGTGGSSFEGINAFFNKYGYIYVQNLYDPKELFDEVPKERGQINYYGSIDKFDHIPEEQQVNGSLARYSHPKYKKIHSQIRIKLEKILGEKLYNTYYYDRFYFPGQELTRHTDRDACEISVTVHISSNSKKYWPIWMKSPEGEERFVEMNPGDGVIYMGCDIEHWREPFDPYQNIFEKLFKKNYYYHQIFFHYVFANGSRVHHAGDMQSI
jgi:hypothetical protein